MPKRIIVTGGSGKAGRYVIEYLLAQGHQILNLDLIPLADDLASKVHTLKIDLTNSGQVFSAVTSHFKLTEPFREPLNQPPDAVVHLAGYARNMIVPENETFTANTIGAYNVIEASCKLGVRKIILASSVCVYGVRFAEGDIDFPSFPVDEEVETNPMDAYSLSKVCIENIAKSFARKYAIDIYAMRIGALIIPEEFDQRFKEYVNSPEKWKVHGWSYTDARDLGKMINLGIQKKDKIGYQAFNATNDDITNFAPSTTEFLRNQCPNIPFSRDMLKNEAPMSNSKVKAMLGFEENHPWMPRFSK